MAVILVTAPLAAEEIDALTGRELRSVVETLEFLCENPLGAPTANLRAIPEARRAVAGNYLIYYTYTEETEWLEILVVRHARRKPLKAKDLEARRHPESEA